MTASTGSRARLVTEIIVLAAVYACVAKLGLMMDAVSGVASLVWPPTGIALVVLIRRGRRLWPGIALGVLAFNLWSGTLAPASIGVALGNSLEAVLGAWALDRFVGLRDVPTRVSQVVGLVLFAALGSTLVSASIGTASLLLGGSVTTGKAAATWWAWWLGDATADMVLAPLLLAWSSEPRAFLRRALANKARLLEATTLGLGFAALLFAVFATPLGAQSALTQPTVIFPFLIWAALRFGLRGATTATFLTSAVAIWGTARGYGPFVHVRLSPSLLFLQVFTAIVSITTLFLAVAIAERDRALRASEAAGRLREEFLQQERAGRARAELLAEVTELLSEVFDYPRMLGELARLCVRSLADWAVIDVLEEGVIRREAGAHRQPELEPLLSELQARYPAAATSNPPAVEVLERGRIFLPEVTEADIRARAVDEAHAQLVTRLGTGSVMAVPLDARGVKLGVLTLCSATRGRYKPADLELARELARRAALAIDNARLLRAEKRALERLARVAIAVRDMANTPLQTLTIGAALLHRNEGNQAEILSRMSRAVDRLRKLDELLSTYSEQFVWHERDAAFDAEAVLKSAGLVPRPLRPLTPVGE